MDPSESLFKGAVRVWRRFRRRRAVDYGPEAVRLADHTDRFRLVAAMLFGDALDVLPASDGVGGVSGSAILLPPVLDLFDTHTGNEEVYVYRIAWSAVTRLLGYEGAVTGRDPLFDFLCTLLAVGRTRAILHSQLPATAELSSRLERAALSRRTTDRVDPLESLVRVLLGDEQASANVDPPARAWIEEAASLRPRSGDELRREAAHLLARLVAIAGRRDPPPAIIIWGGLLPLAPADQLTHDDIDIDETSRGKRTTAIELDRTIRLQRRKLGAREDKPLHHMFEKIETAEEYGGQGSTPDGSGNVRHMEDAVRELSLGTVIRTPEAPQNLVRARVVMEPTEVELGHGLSEPRVCSYPEWSFKSRAYRPDWCHVTEERYQVTEASTSNVDPADAALRPQRRLVESIRGHLLRALYKRQLRNRQTDGPEIDVEAMVERHADLAAGQTPPERLYVAPRRVLRDVAILVLVDASWSTDAWIDGRRVLDIEMSALLLVAKAFEGYLENEVAVATFHSHTRRDVRFGLLKRFDDSWQHLRRTAPSIRPDGYTRIGAAVRHATAILDGARARKKLLLVLSDGKPTDYDRYEGRYGIEDVRQAIREARQAHIHTFGIAIENEAKLYLARMLGRGCYRVLPRPELLPDVMAEVFVHLLTD